LLADAYDADDQTRRAFTAVLMETEDVALNFVTTRIEHGDPAFVDMWNGLGGRDRFDRKMRWIDHNRSRIDDALTA
jgi:hypothetical protein